MTKSYSKSTVDPEAKVNEQRLSVCPDPCHFEASDPLGGTTLTYAGKSKETDVSAFVNGGDSKSAEFSVKVRAAVTGVPAVATGDQIEILLTLKTEAQYSAVVVEVAIMPSICDNWE